MLVTEGLLRRARTAPQHPALVVDGRCRSYGELAAAATATAAAVQDGQAERVGLLLRPGIAFLEVFLGAAMAGAAAMVLDPEWSPPQLRRVLAATPPDVLVAEAPFREAVGGHLPPERLVLVGEEPDDEGRGVPRRRERQADHGGLDAWREAHAGRYPLRAADDERPFYIGFTSGTTGHPKGFVRTHRSWVCSFEGSAVEFGIGERDVVLVPGPLTHSLFLYGAAHGLFAGATVHLLPRFGPLAVLRLLAEHPVTRLYLVPTMVAALLRAAGRQTRAGGVGPSFPQVATVLVSGARWDPAQRAQARRLFPDAEMVEFYGASELSFVSVLSDRDGGPAGSVGRPFHGVEVSIRGADGAELPPGQVGRLYVRSPLVFSGYLRREDGAAARVPGGWLTVGDLARRDERGYLHLLGREDSMIISGGANVHPEEVEAVLQALPEVAEAAVVGLPDTYWGEVVCAVLVGQDGGCLSPARLRRHCRGALARAACPQRFFQAPSLPHTASGKVARGVLREGLTSGTWTARELR